MADGGGAEEVPEHLTCPVCFEVPDSEVYQCLDGHVLCKKCYFQLTECPQCRIPLDATRPIRNRYFEGLLDSIKVKCKYFIRCRTKLPKNEINDHEEYCCYNFNKFGYFVRLCQLIGHSDCYFEVNNGNTEDAVQHFVTAHGCLQFEGKEFQVKLEDLQLNPASKEIQFWTPIISNLSDKQCYIFTMAVMDPKKESVAWLSIFLPYKRNLNRNSPVKTSFTISYGEPFTWTSVVIPVSLSQAEFYLPSNIPSPFQLSWLKSHSSLKDSFMVDFKILPKDGIENDGQPLYVTCTKYSCIPDPVLPEEGNVVDWNSLERTTAAQKLMDRQFKRKENKDRGEVFAFIKEIFESDVEAFPGIINGDMEWLRYGCLFLAAHFGTVNAVQYILNKGLNCNVKNEDRGTPLHWTMYDKNKKIGLKKAKLLVEQGGADPKRVSCFDKETLLHWAVRHSTPEALKYFIELGLDVDQDNGGGMTPLQVLIDYRGLSGEDDALVKMAKMLLESGSSLRTADWGGSLWYNAKIRKLEKIQDMIQAVILSVSNRLFGTKYSV